MAVGAIQLLTVTVLACFANDVSAQRPFNDLRATFTPTYNPNTGFFQIPTTTSSPLMANYVQVAPEAGFQFPMNFYCYPNDPRVCFMYDYNGNVAGAQISYLAQDVANINPNDYNYATINGFVKTNMMNTPAYAFRAYFTNPETLTASGRQNLNETVEGLWVYLNNNLVQIQRNEPSANQLNITGFTRESCYPGMGEHYFWNMFPNVPCNQVFPIYAVYQAGGLVGYGIADFGTPSNGPQRVWYERPSASAVQQIVTTRPACMGPLMQEYGLYSVHIYFVDHPWQITCPA